MDETKITVIGAGVVGLAVTAELAQRYGDICLLEKNESFGLETSSRNSEVIHAGIYYPTGSLKARLSVEGNHTCYQICTDSGIEHRKLGKLIVACNDMEEIELRRIFENGQRNGAPLVFLSQKQARTMEPGVICSSAVFSPTTGIIDAHALMKYFFEAASKREASIAFKARVVGVEAVSAGYKVTVEDASGQYCFLTRVLVNCAGLQSEEVSRLAGIDTVKAGYKMHYYKGEYFRTSKRLSRMLVYPVPCPGEKGLGIHLTPNLQGVIRLGPNSFPVQDINYSVDQRKKQEFFDATRKIVSSVELDDLEPDFAGIRPSLQGDGEGFRDFVIQHEAGRGLPGLINLIGIESPGLTASPAIARYVGTIVRGLL